MLAVGPDARWIEIIGHRRSVVLAQDAEAVEGLPRHVKEVVALVHAAQVTIARDDLRTLRHFIEQPSKTNRVVVVIKLAAHGNDDVARPHSKIQSQTSPPMAFSLPFFSKSDVTSRNFARVE